MAHRAAPFQCTVIPSPGRMPLR
ncbi:hypothetical protein BLA29_015017 [Euroglyphus maynei]|uniref:Uncharacterized protein n=1 Tax=Euroglyphus maynei TaxID=6958 RepID=A0A1Y3BAR1_EURMA|nr:hypothetical protein BLA29_015017 [Euroglyphus maynei]